MSLDTQPFSSPLHHGSKSKITRNAGLGQVLKTTTSYKKSSLEPLETQSKCIHITFSFRFQNVKNKELFSLLDRLLCFNPDKRITVDEALAHPYMKPYYDPTDEPVSQQPFTFDMEFDNLPTKELKAMVFQEAVNFKRKLLKETHL